MKRTLLCIVLVTFHVIVCYAAMAQDIPSVPLTKLIDPKLINITGTWNYTSSASVVTACVHLVDLPPEHARLPRAGISTP